MPRTPRLINPHGTYHIVARGNDRCNIFRAPQDYIQYLSLVSEVKESHGILLYHYCLMPNHVHLEIAPNGADLSRVMHRLQLSYSKYCSARWPHIGHVWQGRFKSLHVATDAYAMACGSYIEMNPVRAGLVRRPEDWPYSSYRYYALGEKNQLVDEDPLYAALGSTPQERCKEYALLITKMRMYSA